MARRRSRRGKDKSAKGKPKKRIFIATEGVTEYLYFKEIKQKLRAGNIDVLKSTSKTSPRQVAERIKAYKPKKGDVRREDERWAVIDKEERNLSEQISSALRKNLYIGDSNPCFEMWLILHCQPLDKLPGLEGSATVGGCDKVIEALKKQVEPNYQKTDYDVCCYAEHWESAIENSKRTDKQRNEIWMNCVGSRVYKLAQSIIDSST